MIACRHISADSFSGTVLKYDTVVIPEHRVLDGGFDAHARCATGEHQVLDPPALEDVVQFSLEESAEAALVDDRVGFRWSQFIDDVGVPCVANQDSTNRAVGSRHMFSRSHRNVFEPVRRGWRAGVKEVGSECHLEIDDLDPRSTCRSEDELRRCDCGLDAR